MNERDEDRHWWHNLEQRYPQRHDFLAYRHSELLRDVVFTIGNDPLRWRLILSDLQPHGHHDWDSS
jgi:hypothetical protein